MGRRGRPPHPDILTPREWEVLALLRDGLTNEAIADRLGVTHAAAKYHVSEILSKLGVATREEAAAWEPEATREPQLRRWWAGAVGWLRPVTLGKVVLLMAAVAVLAGLGVMAWGVVENAGGPASDDARAPEIIPARPGELVIQDPADVQMIVTSASSDGTSVGEMWLANLDGTPIRQLPVAMGVTQRDFIRVGPNIETGNPALYYSAGDFDTDKSVRRLDLDTLEETNIGTIPRCCPDLPHGGRGPRTDVSPDGRFVILFGESFQRLIKRDLATGEDVTLTSGTSEASCELTCKYWDVNWSPNGDFLTASRATVSPEVAGTLVLDMNGNLVTSNESWDAVWSPSGDAICSVSPPDQFDRFVEIRRAPNWKPQRFRNLFEQTLVVSSPVRSPLVAPQLAGCTWIDDAKVAVWQDVARWEEVSGESITGGQLQTNAHLFLIDTNGGEISIVAVRYDCRFESLVSAGRSGLLVMRNSLMGSRCRGPFRPNGPNEVVDVATGASTTNTEAGAIVEALVLPDHPTQSLRTAARVEHR